MCSIRRRITGASRSGMRSYCGYFAASNPSACRILDAEVEYQLIEAPVEVRLHLRDVLVGVGRHDEAGVRPVGGGRRTALHLSGILDPRFVLGGQRERGPLPGVLHRPRAIVI